MFETFHQSPHGDFKPTFYNPFEVKHRRRTTKAQYNVLEEAYQENNKPSAAARKVIANKLGMTARAVQVWFQNRRAKDKSRTGFCGGEGLDSNVFSNSNLLNSSSPDIRSDHGGVCLASIVPPKSSSHQRKRLTSTGSGSLDRISNGGAAEGLVRLAPHKVHDQLNSMARRHSMPDMQQPALACTSSGQLPFKELHEAIFGKNNQYLGEGSINMSSLSSSTTSAATNCHSTMGNASTPSLHNSVSHILQTTTSSTASLGNNESRIEANHNSGTITKPANFLLPYYQQHHPCYLNSIATGLPMISAKQAIDSIGGSADPMFGGGVNSNSVTGMALRVPQRTRSQGDLRAPSISAPESSPNLHHSFSSTSGIATPTEEVYQQLREFIQLTNTPGLAPPAVNHLLVDRVVSELENFTSGELGILLEETAAALNKENRDNELMVAMGGVITREGEAYKESVNGQGMMDFFATSPGPNNSTMTGGNVDMATDLHELLLPTTDRCSPGDPMFHSIMADQYFFPPHLSINTPFNYGRN